MRTPPDSIPLTDAQPDSLALIWKLASDARRIHEHSLQLALQRNETAGSCLFASVLLASTVNRFSAWTARVRGGAFQTGDGAHHGHYWVHVNLLDAHFVLDITNDQFGGPDVLLLPLAAAEQFHPQDDDEIEDHIRELGLPPVLTEKARKTPHG